MADQQIYDRILFGSEQLDMRISELAALITDAYGACENVTALVLLEGARVFADRLFSKLNLPLDVEYMKISSYHGGTKSTGEILFDFPSHLCAKFQDRNILIIDDIYDTGLTLHSLIEHIQDYKPKSIKTCILLGKKRIHKKEVQIDFLGFSVEDVFVIGYGMDYKDQYRDLPFVAALSDKWIEDNSNSSKSISKKTLKV
jgi:hypoxanthine phosphoribosyltransferase